jgi:hypothetical protein
MANKGYSDVDSRFDCSGPLNTVRLSAATKAPGVDNCPCYFGPETVGVQQRAGGWHNLDRPSNNEGNMTADQLNKQPAGYNGGDADSQGKGYVPAAYPGGTVA